MLAAQNKGRVFVTDGSYPNALAAVRALGRAGYTVTVGERDGVSLPETISFWSRHCARRVRYPHPTSGAAAEFLARHFREHHYDAAIPIGLDMTRVFVENAARLHVPTLLPRVETFKIAGDKRETYAHCAS